MYSLIHYVSIRTCHFNIYIYYIYTIDIYTVMIIIIVTFLYTTSIHIKYNSYSLYWSRYRAFDNHYYYSISVEFIYESYMRSLWWWPVIFWYVLQYPIYVLCICNIIAIDNDNNEFIILIAIDWHRPNDDDRYANWHRIIMNINHTTF